MEDQSSSDLRQTILDLASIDATDLAQQLTLEETEAVADSLQKIVNSLRHRLKAAGSPLKESGNRIATAKHRQFLSCLQDLRRHLTAVCVEPLPLDETGFSTRIRGEFKIVHQIISPFQPQSQFTDIELEILSVKGPTSSNKLVAANALINGEWASIWSLNLSQSDYSTPILHIDEDYSSVSDPTVAFLHLKACSINFSENIFLLALAKLLVDSAAKYIGEDLIEGDFEELMASLIDSKRSMHYTEAPLALAPQRPKRAAFQMDDELSELSTQLRRPRFGDESDSF